MGLRFTVLGLLSREPNTGYGLHRLLNGSLSHVWDARLQQVYAELGKLYDQGLVTIEAFAMPRQPTKKVYTLTDSGENILDEWLTLRPATQRLRDDLLVKIYCLERLSSGPAIRHLRERRAASVEGLAHARRTLEMTSRTDPGTLGDRLTLEASVFREEAEIAWCDRAIEMLHDEMSVEARGRVADAAGA